MRKFLISFFLLGLAAPTLADEGMWTLDNPPTKRIHDAYGFSPSPAWLDKAMHASARLALGCSASFVSKGGLVLTNHHCVAKCVEQLGDAQHDMLKLGFVARTREEEHQCPAMEVNRLEKITDVTKEVTDATAGLDGAAYKAAGNAVRAKLTSACVGADGNKARCDVVDLYQGGQYKLYRYHRFLDVRLVFAPEQSVAFFGGDPDNFNFPRYDLDMSMVRVYEDGKPAIVSDYFPVSAHGPAPGELVFVTGHPGSTQRELTVAQLTTRRNLILPDTLLRLAEYRGVLEEYRTTGSEPSRYANAELFYVENSYKALRGQLEALLDDRIFQKKIDEENALRAFAQTRPELKDAPGAWDATEKAEASYRALFRERSALERGNPFMTDYFGFARTLVRAAAERAKPNGERLAEYADAALPEVEARLLSPAPVHPEFEKLRMSWALTKIRESLGADHPIVKQLLGKESPEQVATRLIDGTHLGDPQVRKALWTGGAAAVAASDDPFIQFAAAIDPAARALRKRFEAQVESVEQKSAERIARVRFAQLGTDTYPDATFTLRVSYGAVKGWDEAGVAVPPFTRIGGAFDRATGADPFRLPDSWIKAKGALDLTKPFNFVSTNDIIGGNSGSPVVDRDGRLVGLIFDGNIHSLGGAYGYDAGSNRAVAVDSAAILEGLEKIYGAKALADEMRAP